MEPGSLSHDELELTSKTLLVTGQEGFARERPGCFFTS